MKEQIKEILKEIGEDPNRNGLIDTPKRIEKAYAKIFGGYDKNVDDVLTVFDSEGYDELVALTNIDFYSTCEHHMLPFYGQAHIGYIPDGKIVGISKLARITDIYARRLQNQERLTNQITQTLEKALNPLGVIVVLEGIHLCMKARGVEKQNAVMKTSKVIGVFKQKTNLAREEFFNILRNGGVDN